MKGALLLSVLLLVGCAAPTPAPAMAPSTATVAPVHAAQRELREVLIDPGQFAEVNFRMDKNASIDFAFNMSSAVIWDVHSHPNGSLAEWRKGRAASMNGTFVAPADDIYSVLLEWDGGPSARGNVSVVGDFTLYP